MQSRGSFLFLLPLLVLVPCARGFATVQSVWGGCYLLSNGPGCLCNASEFDHFAWATSADAGLLRAWTGFDDCDLNMPWFHGAPGAYFLEFVSWLYVYGQAAGRPDVVTGSVWMALDPALDGASLWPNGHGGIEGKGFSPSALYNPILPMAVGLDAFLYRNASCGFDPIVARTLPDSAINAMWLAIAYAVTHNASAGWSVPDRGNFTACMKRWHTDGITTWMSAFVLPVGSAQEGLTQFAKHVLWNGNGTDVANALRLYDDVVLCSRVVHGAWLQSLQGSGGLAPAARVAQAQAAATSVLEAAMEAGQCGAPAYSPQ